MVLDVRERSKVADRPSSGLPRIVVQQVEEILIETGGPDANRDQFKERQWSYRIPCPGVRYYSY